MFTRIRNALDYPLRQFFHWSRPGCVITNENKKTFLDDLAAEERPAAAKLAAGLEIMYDLDFLRSHSTLKNYRENLFYLHLLDATFTSLPESDSGISPETLSAADVGVSHWFYVQALYAFLTKNPDGPKRGVRLEGYEADAYRVYADLFSRADHAQAHIRGLDGVTYIPRPFTGQKGAYDLVTLFFPFVFLRDHLTWGLPQSAFNPTRLLDTVWFSLKPGGILLIVNQGEEEHHEQARILEKSGISVRYRSEFSSPLFSYDLARFVILARK